jgi:hypothetical protein
MQNNFKDAKMQTSQAPHVDGTFELTFGIMFLLAATCFWGSFKLGSTHSFLGTNVLPFVTIAVFLSGGLGIDQLVKWFKKRFTLPRIDNLTIGNAGSFNRAAQIAIWIGIPVLTLVLMAVLYINKALIQNPTHDATSLLMPAFWGLLFSGLWFLVGRKIGLNRFNLMAVVSLAIGGALFFNGADGTLAMMILFGALGTALCISGGITMWQYLRNSGLRSEVIPEE